MLVVCVVNDTTIKVIHYTGDVRNAGDSFSSFGSAATENAAEDADAGRAEIAEQNIVVDLKTEKLEVLDYAEGERVFSPSESIERARNRLQEKDYSLWSNNCECFVNWAITDRAVSNQVSAGLTFAGIGAAAGAYQGYKEGGVSGAMKGLLGGAVRGFEEYREKRQ